MRIHFFGATRTTTGSMYLFEINGKRLLLECGLFQGHREEMTSRNRNFPFDPKQIHAVVLSHAHIDHAGNLPNLVKQGYSGPIYCTPATHDLCSIMLVDSAHIQADDAKFVSKKHARKNKPGVEPLYTIEDAQQAVKQLNAVKYEQPFQPVDGVTVTFRDAGPILGSAQVILDIQEGARKFRHLFSGDVGRGRDEMLCDPIPVENVDYLQVESTYASREHKAPQDADDLVCRFINDALRNKGKIIIPSFSVGRTQQIVYVLHRITLSQCLPVVPIFVDSPLSTNATGIYRKHPECFNETFKKFLLREPDAFGMANLIYIRDAEESKKLNDRKEPMIIISASGMCEAGRIRHHLKNNITDARNMVLFVGYCAEGTLGAMILAGRSPVNIFGEPYVVHAKIASIDSYSGHADKNELRRYVEKISGDFKKIICIHGEESECLAHADTLRTMKPRAQVIVPEYKQVVEI